MFSAVVSQHSREPVRRFLLNVIHRVRPIDSSAVFVGGKRVDPEVGVAMQVQEN